MLSGGQRKRVGLAQVLIRDPKILLMDEPFGPLDAQTRQIMGNLLLELWNADRKAVLFVTHDLEEAIALADRVVIMSAGPGARIIGDWKVALPRPRDISEVRMEKEFHAKAAGVALDTVYATVGKKPALFRLLIEMAISGSDAAVPAEEREYVQAIRAEPDAAKKLRIYAAALCSIQERLAPLFGVLQGAAPIDPELAALWQGICNAVPRDCACSPRTWLQPDVSGPIFSLPERRTLFGACGD